MRFTTLACLICLLPSTHTALPQDAPHAQAYVITPPAPSNDYPLTADSKPQPNVPRGTVFHFSFSNSHIFPGTTHTITVYVPAQYTGDKPACVFVHLDGIGSTTSVVFDNLIAQHAMPITIAIGVAPGTLPAGSGSEVRFDRSMEFDSRTPRLASFLLDEVLPAVEKSSVPDGRHILLSTNPNDRAIGGGSTGGIAAFTVAWERPDAFRRVFTAISTFVGMRGGEQYYVTVRKTEPKPIRIFMQDGANDEWPVGPEMGDWWMSNQTMQRALEFAGYDVRHVWGAGTHNGSQADALFPEAMRWLWRDWPAPIAAMPPGNPVLKVVLRPGEDWQVAAENCPSSLSLASSADGHVYVPITNGPDIAPLDAHTCTAAVSTPFVFGPDGRRYIAAQQEAGSIIAYDAAGKDTVVAQLRARALTVTHSGNVYAATQDDAGKSTIWLSRPAQAPLQVVHGLKDVSALALSPDGLWLFAAQRNSHLSYNYRVQPDGTLDSGEPFYDLAVPASADGSGASSVAMDRDGRAYVATYMGIQIMDHNGRVAAILPLPGNLPATSVCFAGDDFSILYVSSGGKVYRRKLNVPGLPPASPPVKVPNWGAG
jgi:enterochelin esterase-like enzyme